MIAKLFTASNGTRLTWRIRLMQALQARGLTLPARYVAYRTQRIFGVYIATGARLARSVSFPHPVGIVVGNGVVIGERVRIYQHVTLGGARIGDWKKKKYPKIGDDCVLFAGAVIVGDIRIGNNCVIGANSVVLSDVPDNSVAVGSPARIIKSKRPVQADAPVPNTLSES